DVVDVRGIDPSLVDDGLHRAGEKIFRTYVRERPLVRATDRAPLRGNDDCLRHCRAPLFVVKFVEARIMSLWGPCETKPRSTGTHRSWRFWRRASAVAQGRSSARQPSASRSTTSRIRPSTSDSSAWWSSPRLPS